MPVTGYILLKNSSKLIGEQCSAFCCELRSANTVLLLPLCVRTSLYVRKQKFNENIRVWITIRVLIANTNIRSVTTNTRVNEKQE